MSGRLVELIAEPPFDADGLRRFLDRLPFAFRDPVQGRLWHVSYNAAGARWSRAAREADPTRFPVGVLVGVEDGGVWLDVFADDHDRLRAREIVDHVLALGTFRARVDGRDAPASGEVLVPGPFPDPSVDDGAPVEFFTGVGPKGPATRLAVDPAGRAELSFPREPRPPVRARLDDALRARWAAAVSALDLDADLDGAPEDRQVAASIPHGEEAESVYYDGSAPPPTWEAFTELAAEITRALASGDASVPGLLPA